jgi:hypothetical protein
MRRMNLYDGVRTWNLRCAVGEPLKDTPHGEAVQPVPARTRLGERLSRIRERIIASGEPLLSWAEIEREVAERRGEAEQRG